MLTDYLGFLNNSKFISSKSFCNKELGIDLEIFIWGGLFEKK